MSVGSICLPSSSLVVEQVSASNWEVKEQFRSRFVAVGAFTFMSVWWNLRGVYIGAPGGNAAGAALPRLCIRFAASGRSGLAYETFQVHNPRMSA